MIGISVLTNSNRKAYLQFCIESFLENCSYRPLIWGIFDNGSTDDTFQYIQSLKDTSDVKWRVERSDIDLGFGPGVNRANNLVSDCEYSIELECDWIHMPEYESGVPKTWLNEALEFLQDNECDYLYLRRIRNEQEMMYHFWSQWMPKCVEIRDGKFLKCPPFWFSTNPNLRKYQNLVRAGTFPMPEYYNDKGNPIDKKGMPHWNKSEMNSKNPPNAWIYMWGMFAHERKNKDAEFPNCCGCGIYGPYGTSTCKYGFYDMKSQWCRLCDAGTDFEDMPLHEKRYRQVCKQPSNMKQLRDTLQLPVIDV